MDTFIADLTPGAMLVIVLVVALIWSLISLFDYFFGGPDPLVENTRARVEAAQNPANLLNANAERKRRQRLGRILIIIVIVLILCTVAPVQMATIARALWDAGVKLLEAVRASAQVLFEQLSQQ